MAKKKAVPLGKAIVWTDEEIEDFQQVTPVDIDIMRMLWKKYAPARFRDLIDAQDDDATTISDQ